MSQLDRMEDKLDKVIERLGEHSTMLKEHEMLHKQSARLHEQNTKDLTEHIRRTNLLEDHQKSQDLDIKKIEEKVEEARLPVAIFQFVWKNLPKLGAVIAAGGSVYAALKFLF